jgi:ABC-type branched-subunit amino acid transport system ATPase component
MSTLLNTAVIGASRATAGRVTLCGAAVTPHVVVGIFIVNNNPETMALLFLQPTVCMGSISQGQQKARRSRPGRAARVFSVNMPFWKILVT